MKHKYLYSINFPCRFLFSTFHPDCRTFTPVMAKSPKKRSFSYLAQPGEVAVFHFYHTKAFPLFRRAKRLKLQSLLFNTWKKKNEVELMVKQIKPNVFLLLLLLLLLSLCFSAKVSLLSRDCFREFYKSIYMLTGELFCNKLDIYDGE